jgi:hypothetical protein
MIVLVCVMFWRERVNPLPDYLIKRLQKIQFSAASFGTGKFVNFVKSLLTLGWLPIRERWYFSLLKATQKAIYAQRHAVLAELHCKWSTQSGSKLRSSTTLNLVRPPEKGTFQDIYRYNTSAYIAYIFTRKYMHAETLAMLTKPLHFPNMKYLK